MSKMFGVDLDKPSPLSDAEAWLRDKSRHAPFHWPYALAIAKELDRLRVGSGGQPKLTPPDVTRCQAEVRSFMTLGPGRNRCGNVPVVIAEEREPGTDGQRGSMALCDGCRDALVRLKGDGYAQFTPIGQSHK